MDNTYLPTFLMEQSWPESVKKDFTATLHKFMAVLTEATYQARNETKLYIPQEEITSIEIAAQDKDLIYRLESMTIHWTRQIKDVINKESNNESSQESDELGPIEEIQFWTNRSQDLKRIATQLKKPELLKILSVLKKNTDQ
jgi:dynein heavy chain